MDNQTIIDAYHSQNRLVTVPDEAIKTQFLGIMTILGIKSDNLPGPEQFKIIRKSVKEIFPWFTLEEVSNAFKMAIAGEIDVKFEMFGGFNMMLISEVLKKYRSYSVPIVNRHGKIMPPENQLQISGKTLDDDLTNQGILASIDYFRKNNKFDFEGSYQLSANRYDYLDQQKKLQLDADSKWQYMEDAKKYLADKKQAELSRNPLNKAIRDKIIKDNPDPVNVAKMLALMDYIKNECL